MRTLTSAIMGIVELLLDSGNIGKQELDYVTSLEKSVGALTLLVENTLEYACAESGRLELDEGT